MMSRFPVHTPTVIDFELQADVSDVIIGDRGRVIQVRYLSYIICVTWLDLCPLTVLALRHACAPSTPFTVFSLLFIPWDMRLHVARWFSSSAPTP
jgi:hypothetical protein